MDPLSEALVSEGMVSEEKLKEIKERTPKGRSFILEMLDTVPVDEERLASIYTERFRITRVSPRDVQPEALRRYSEKLAFKYLSIPFAREGLRLKVAMVDPLDLDAVQDISFITGLTVVPFVATRTEVLTAINNCYEVSSEIVNILDNISSTDVENIEFIEEDSQAATAVFQSGQRLEIPDEETLSAPAIKLVNILLKDAMQSRASDIHIEPGQKAVEVRFRIDGVLKPHMEVPRWLHSALVSRIKIMSKLDISNRRTPQDGAIKIRIAGNPVDLRVSTLPTNLGEKAVIRLLNPEEGELELKDTGIGQDDYSILKRSFSQPQGMILVTGPTGSGKTTTLHGILKELNTGQTNIITVEDPVEYELKGITQVQVNEKAGLTFANTLRSILRQDPDIVMVGEIRDRDTAEIAFRASMTGHLVLSTLHTNDTTSTITRLLDIGVEPYILASSLLSIAAQRLVRINCGECTVSYVPPDDVISLLPKIDSGARYVRGKGCDRCNNTGYRGRVAVFEILEVTPSIKSLISSGASEKDIRSQARKEGMKTLYEAAMEKVYRRLTTPEEILRVIAPETVRERYCPVCCRTYTESECPYCGEPSEGICTGCGRPVSFDWRFCPNCGRQKGPGKRPELPSTPRVLAVDDEPGVLKMIEVALRPLALEIHTARNGREALDLTQRVNPSLIITDINMPVLDGFELIRHLRSRVNTMFIPIIILSSRDTSEDKLRGFTYGTDDYITKPFEYTELQARVKRLLQRTHA